MVATKFYSILGHNKEVGEFVTTAPKIILLNIEGLRYMPQQLSTDAIEISHKLHSYEGIFTKEIFETLQSFGKKIDEIAKELNVSTTTVLKYLKKFGLYEPSVKKIEIDKTELQEMVNLNMSFNKMAEKYGISTTALKNHLKKYGLYKSRSKGTNTPDIILDKAELLRLANNNMSINEIASKLGVSQYKVRYYFEKYNLVSNYQNNHRLCQAYRAATTETDKAKAFAEIDKQLEEIARREFELKENSTFEDCLQDVRLRFLEAMAQKEKGSKYNPISMTEKSAPLIPEEIETFSIGTIETAKFDIPVSDSRIERFESTDFDEHALQYFCKHLPSRKSKMLKEYLIEGKTLVEIAKSYNLTTSRTRDILHDACEEANQLCKDFSKQEYL